MDVNILNNILKSRILQYIKRITGNSQVGFIPEMQGLFHIWK